jgi:hypothetical protein
MAAKFNPISLGLASETIGFHYLAKFNSLGLTVKPHPISLGRATQPPDHRLLNLVGPPDPRSLGSDGNVKPNNLG